MSPLLDANILLYAKFSDFPQHGAARQWLDERLRQPDPVAIPWVSLCAFVRIATNRRVFAQPLDSERAVAQVSQWLSCSNVWTPEPGERFAALFTGLVVASQASGNLVADAYLAALALEHGLTVVSSDADFARFRGLNWLDPIAG